MNTATNCFQSFPSCLISPLETMAIDLICLVAFFLFLAFPLARIPAPFSRVNCVGRLGGSRGFRAWRFSFFFYSFDWAGRLGPAHLFGASANRAAPC